GGARCPGTATAPAPGADRGAGHGGGGTMSVTVCLAPANTIGYPQGGGHLWVYLQWALGLRALGCRGIWREGVDLGDGDESARRRRRWRGRDVHQCVTTLKARLQSLGFEDALAL